MNVLILSAGTRNKIVAYFKRALTAPSGERTGRVLATDMSLLAPALYEADAHYLVPSIQEAHYFEKVQEICEKEKIQVVLSLIDPELSLLAAHKQWFEERNMVLLGSSLEVCERALDKMQMHDWLVARGYRTAESYSCLEDFERARREGRIDYPVFVKPSRGSASLAVNKVYEEETLHLLWRKTPGLMIQEFLQGQEIGADVYIDQISGEVVSIFTKKKLLMRAGETDKSVSFKDPALFALLERFVKDCGFMGQIDVDVFEVAGEYYISEVNPRFGGGYPHAYECGVDHMKLILNNAQGIANQRRIGDYEEGVYMMKYNEVLIQRGEGV
ncbi:Carbamoyl-phosphate synthase large chain [Clostridiaceae bacterium JG1575]|nr:Carbamoyl-phosphate synthase large chain [Clostridiaceae bacterium JG1575]